MSRELDTKVALILGYTFETFPDGNCPEIEHWSMPNGNPLMFNPPAFSTCPTACAEVEAEAKRRGFVVKTEAYPNDYVEAELYDPERWRRGFHADDKTRMLAVCRAFLAMCEAEEKTDD